MNLKWIKIFLRLAISIGFISAVADRFGCWSVENSTWGNWENFLDYTNVLNPLIPDSLIPTAAVIATGLEIVFALFLLVGFKTELTAKLSGYLLLIFALSMTFTIGIKGPLDYSVYTAAAGAFALGSMKEKYLELDLILGKNTKA